MKNLILILFLLFISCDPEYKTIEARDTNFKWERIVCGPQGGPNFYRTRIYGGWLVTPCSGETITFIPLQNPDGWEIKPITNQNKAK